MFQQKRNITEMYQHDKGTGSGGEGRAHVKRILCLSQKFKGMETENKSHELDKNPVGPSTSGRKEKAWSDHKYPIVLL